MPHMIDQTTGRAAMAYVGETPWHRLGHEMRRGAPIEEWTDKAGLDGEVLRSPVLFQDARRFCGPLPDGYFPIQRFSDREVLYRSDTGAPLGIASNEYKTVQPKEVMSFFDDLAKLGNFSSKRPVHFQVASGSGHWPEFTMARRSSVKTSSVHTCF